MISYIQRKFIDKNLLNSYINISEEKNWFSNNGPVKAILEKKLESIIGIPSDKRILCVSNGTTALHALIFYYDRLYGRTLKWISPSFTFPSCVVNQTNTVLVDIDPITKTIRPEDISEDIDGIIITNLFGCILDFDISQFKDKLIIYDNASSFLTSDKNGNNMCLKGTASFGSLHHTKSLGFGEGGFVVVDKNAYDDIQAICGFGFNNSRIHDVRSSNFKMSDVSAAYILQHIDNYDIQKHKSLQKIYRDNLEGIEIFNYDDNVFYGNLPIIFKHETSISTFRELEIEVNKYYLPLEKHTNSINLYNKIINFPLHNGLSESDIKYICSTIKNNYN